MEVVVLPTPPFWFATHIVLGMAKAAFGKGWLVGLDLIALFQAATKYQSERRALISVAVNTTGPNHFFVCRMGPLSRPPGKETLGTMVPSYEG